MTHASSTLIDYIIPDNYETCVVADTFLKTDHFATIKVFKSVNLKSETTKKNSTKKLFSHSVPKFIENSDWRHFYGAVTGDMMFLEFQRAMERALALQTQLQIKSAILEKTN